MGLSKQRNLYQSSPTFLTICKGPIITNIGKLDIRRVLSFFLAEMELTTDELLESIGSFGRYQIMLNVFCNLAYMFWWGIPVMVMVFIASDPGWKCKNNTTCPFTETIRLGDDNYSYRCDIPREDWEFGNDFTSVVTEVNYMYKNRFSFELCLVFSIPLESEPPVPLKRCLNDKRCRRG